MATISIISRFQRAARGKGEGFAVSCHTVLRSIAMAWVLTLPVAMILSGTLFLIFRQIF